MIANIKQIELDEAFDLAKSGEEAVFLLSVPEDICKARVKSLKHLTIGEFCKRKAEGYIAFKLEVCDFE